MDTNEKQNTAYGVTSKPRQPQYHYRFYYPNLKRPQTNPFAGPMSCRAQSRFEDV